MPGSELRFSPSPAQLAREQVRATRKRKSVLVSFISTLAFALVAALMLVNTPGWSRVVDSFFNLEVAIQSLPRVLDGILLNLRVLAFAVVGVLVFGLLLAILRTLKNPALFPLRVFARGYVDFFRGVPLIIVLYVVGFGLPGLRLEFLGRLDYFRPSDWWLLRV